MKNSGCENNTHKDINQTTPTKHSSEVLFVKHTPSPCNKTYNVENRNNLDTVEKNTTEQSGRPLNVLKSTTEYPSNTAQIQQDETTNTVSDNNPINPITTVKVDTTSFLSAAAHQPVIDTPIID
eukprot:UN29278